MNEPSTAVVEEQAANAVVVSHEEVKESIAASTDNTQAVWRMDNYESMSPESLMVCAQGLQHNATATYIEKSRLVFLLFQRLPEEQKQEVNKAYTILAGQLQDMLKTKVGIYQMYEVRNYVNAWEPFQVALEKGLMSKASEALTLFPNVKLKGYYQYCATYHNGTPVERLTTLKRLDETLRKLNEGETLDPDKDFTSASVRTASDFKRYLQATYDTGRNNKRRAGIPPKTKWVVDIAIGVTMMEKMIQDQNVDGLKHKIQDIKRRLDIAESRLSEEGLSSMEQ